MTNFAVLPVKVLSLHAVKLPHSSAKIGLRCINHQVIMVAHQTIRAQPTKSLYNMRWSIKKYHRQLNTSEFEIHCLYDVYLAEVILSCRATCKTLGG